jgi:hypothetical protein
VFPVLPYPFKKLLHKLFGQLDSMRWVLSDRVPQCPNTRWLTATELLLYQAFPVREDLVNPPADTRHVCTSFVGVNAASRVRTRTHAGPQAGNSMNVAVCMSVYLFSMLWVRRIDELAYDPKL